MHQGFSWEMGGPRGPGSIFLGVMLPKFVGDLFCVHAFLCWMFTEGTPLTLQGGRAIITTSYEFVN